MSDTLQVTRQLLSLLPDALYSDMLDWLYKFSRNTKIGYRVFALDVFNELVQIPTRKPSTGNRYANEGRFCYNTTIR